MFTTLESIKAHLSKPKHSVLSDEQKEKLEARREQMHKSFASYNLLNTPNAKITESSMEYLAKVFSGIPCKAPLFGGSVGTGKTIAVSAISAYLVKMHRSCKFVTADDFTRQFESVQDQSHWLKDWRAPEYLVIDDFGREDAMSKYSAGKVEALSSLIQLRHEEFVRNGKATIITTNLNSQKIKERYGDRILSRLLEMCDLVDASGVDLRGMKVAS